MNSKDYVLNHNYGYGDDYTEINKLELRNYDDLIVYLKDILSTAFVAKLDGFVLKFDDKTVPNTKIIVKRA